MLKVTDELQMGIPESLYSPDKVFNVDFSEYDLTTKEGKKAAKAKAESATKRFVRREFRTKGHFWSQPKIDFKAGTVTISHSKVMDIAHQAFLDAGLKYNFDIPVLSEWSCGKSWALTH